MKVAHVAIATPRRCGLYETARELVAAERALGLDARIVDPRPHPTLGVTGADRGVPIADMDWAVEADLIVSHSGHDGTPLAETAQPIIVAAHGRPVSTFIMEREGGAPAYTYHATRSRDSRYIGCVTFWPEYVPYFRGLWGDKPVHAVPAPVDLEYWMPGPTSYDFAGRRGEINVVMTDPWSRRDVCLLPAIHAFEVFRRERPGARLHIYAHDGNKRGLGAIKSMLGDSLGVVQGWASDLRPVYRAADVLLTPHRIDTRAVREAMACGVQVADGRLFPADAVDQMAGRIAARIDRPRNVRAIARKRFAPESAGRAMVDILRQTVAEAAA